MTSTPVRALLLGALSGARSMTPTAVLALQYDRPAMQGTWQGWPVFRSPVGRGLLVLAAVGELVGDKLPATPSRIGVGPLVGRAASGAIVGLALGSVPGERTRQVQAAAFGAVGAVLGSVVGLTLRSGAAKATHTPDWLWALVEDGVTVGGAFALLRR